MKEIRESELCHKKVEKLSKMSLDHDYTKLEKDVEVPAKTKQRIQMPRKQINQITRQQTIQLSGLPPNNATEKTVKISMGQGFRAKIEASCAAETSALLCLSEWTGKLDEPSKSVQVLENSSKTENSEIPKDFGPYNRGRDPYTNTEEASIVKDIIDNRGYNRLKGNQFWQECKERGIACQGNRTWQSMKERFRKKISPNIHNYDLTDQELGYFRKCQEGILVEFDSSSDEESMSESVQEEPMNHHDQAIDLNCDAKLDHFEDVDQSSPPMKKCKKAKKETINQKLRLPYNATHVHKNIDENQVIRRSKRIRSFEQENLKIQKEIERKEYLQNLRQKLIEEQRLKHQSKQKSQPKYNILLVPDFACAFCDEHFVTLGKLNQHVQSEHTGKINAPPTEAIFLPNETKSEIESEIEIKEEPLVDPLDL